MAVIVSNGDTDLHTTNGFYRAESYNMYFSNQTFLALSTTRTINVTFANAGNCKGLIITLFSNNNTTTRDVTVKLKESGVERASKTLTTSDIVNAGEAYGIWTVPFEFATPYAVDTTASKWTFEISQGSGTNDWYLQTSNGTAPSYVTWCDNAVTFANNDSVICKDKVTVTQSADFQGTYGTGDTRNPTAILVCRANTPPTKTNNAVNFQIQNTTAIQVNIKGCLVFSSQGGFQAGTSTTPIASANPLKILWGDAPSSGWVGLIGAGQYGYCPKATFLMYGEVPTNRYYEYTANPIKGNTYFDVADTTGINTGDTFWLSGIGDGTTQDSNYYTVTGTTATRVSITPAIALADRKVGYKAYRASGYGIEFNYKNTSTLQLITSQANNLYFTGVSLFVTDSNANLSFSARMSSIGQGGQEASDRSDWEIYKCIKGRSNTYVMEGNVPPQNVKISETYGFGSLICLGNFNQNDYWTEIGTLEEYDNYSSMIWSQGRQVGSFGYPTWDIQRNLYENMSIGTLMGKNSIFKDNYIKGGSGGGTQMQLSNFLNCVDWSNNTWDTCPTALQLQNVVLNVKMVNEHRIGTVGWQYYPNAGATIIDLTIQNPDFDVPFYAPYRQLITEGSRIGVVGNNASDNSFSYLPLGTITRTGTGLTDTTVRTAGGFAMRFEPTYSPNLMHWEQIIPTGNIQNKTMTVSLWVKINNSAYWAGTHTKPTLTIDYDNGTTISSVAQANTNWQQLACTFTPATTYGQIEMKVTGATDATGTDRYFYVDDVNVAYPAGVAIDLGNLDLWAEGLPVAPAIATVPSLGGVWDEMQTSHNIAGSFGAAAVAAQKDSALSNVLIQDQLS